MAFIKLNFYSQALGTQTEVNVVIPQRSTIGQIGIESKASKDKYKCLYLLHGLSDDHTIWMRRTSIERYASEYGICVVMPNGGRSFYTDMKYGLKYYTFITEELPAMIQDLLPVSDKREDNYVAGLSMGGYGALKIAMRECDRFCAGAGISSVADIRRKDFHETEIPIFGENLEIPDDDDLFRLAEKCNANPNKPRIYMGVGTSDFMYDDNVRLREKFETLNFDYTYRESEGTHNWAFWDEYIQYILEWMFK